MKLSGCDGISFELTITGYQFPNLDDRHQSDWLNVHTEVRHPLGSWLSEFSCLFTYEVEWLIRWLKKVVSGQVSCETCFFTEPNLEFATFLKTDKQILRVNLSHEMAPPWLQSKDEAIEGFDIDFKLKELELDVAIQALCENLKRYPPRGAHALWLTSEAYYYLQPLSVEAMRLKRAGDYRSAINLLKRTLDESKKYQKKNVFFDEYWFLHKKYELADCYFRLAKTQGDFTFYTEAESLLQELIESCPIEGLVEDTWYSLGQLYLMMERQEDGQRAFEQLLSNFPASKFKEKVQGLLALSE